MGGAGWLGVLYCHWLKTLWPSVSPPSRCSIKLQTCQSRSSARRTSDTIIYHFGDQLWHDLTQPHGPDRQTSKHFLLWHRDSFPPSPPAVWSTDTDFTVPPRRNTHQRPHSHDPPSTPCSRTWPSSVTPTSNQQHESSTTTPAHPSRALHAFLPLPHPDGRHLPYQPFTYRTPTTSTRQWSMDSTRPGMSAAPPGAGIPTEQIPLVKLLHHGWTSFWLRRIAHGQPVHLVCARDMAEAVLLAELSPSVRARHLHSDA